MLNRHETNIIQQINWIPMNKGNHAPKVDNIRINFTKLGEKGCGARIVITKEIINKLGWQAKDKILVCQDPDNLLHFLLTNNPNNGYSLDGNGKTAATFHIGFSWRHPKRPEFGSYAVEYFIHPDASLTFKVKNKIC